MITFERTFNRSIIHRIMTHPQLWENTTDDFAGDRESFEPRIEDNIWYVLAKQGDEEILGMFIFAMQNPICWELHARMLPEYWGDTAREAGRAVLQWGFDALGAHRIVTQIFASNRLAVRYAERCGLVQYGINPGSAMKGGKPLDMVLLGVSRP
jgi:RimJ/RimL family protein N-acetyltransferase